MPPDLLRLEHERDLRRRPLVEAVDDPVGLDRRALGLDAVGLDAKVLEEVLVDRDLGRALAGADPDLQLGRALDPQEPLVVDPQRVAGRCAGVAQRAGAAEQAEQAGEDDQPERDGGDLADPVRPPLVGEVLRDVDVAYAGQLAHPATSVTRECAAVKPTALVAAARRRLV